jgi:class 3 adenylate cyclase
LRPGDPVAKEVLMHDTATATYTFFFTDIEGSTRCWAEHPAAMPGIIERHDRLMDAVVARHGGSVFKRVGDAVCAVFGSASAAMSAAVTAQRELAATDWSPLGALRVRMALHSGEAQSRDEDYFGTTVNRAARLLSAGNGGQVLVSDAFEALVADQIPAGLALKSLGEHRLKDPPGAHPPGHRRRLDRDLPGAEDPGQPPQQPAPSTDFVHRA